MTADQSFTRETVRRFLFAHLTRTLFVAVFLAWSGALWCGGRAHGITQITATMHDSLRRVQAQQLRQISRQATSDSIAAVAAQRAAMETRKTYTQRKAVVKLISDTVIQVTRDSVAFTVEVPREIPALINRADATIIADSIAFRAQAAVLADVRAERDLWKARAENDEAQLKTQKRPRFGFRSGVAVGAAAVIALAHFLL